MRPASFWVAAPSHLAQLDSASQEISKAFETAETPEGEVPTMTEALNYVRDQVGESARCVDDGRAIDLHAVAPFIPLIGAVTFLFVSYMVNRLDRRSMAGTAMILARPGSALAVCLVAATLEWHRWLFAVIGSRGGQASTLMESSRGSH